MPRALVSVYDKTSIIELGRDLSRRGFELVSTDGTARALADAGLAVTGVSDLTGFPELMDGRVKTLHPALHGGILARRDRADDLAALERHGIGLVDLVVVNLYPFLETARKPGVAFDELIEQIDIGGPSLVRAAAKNFRGVLVVVDPRRYGELVEQLDRDGGPTLEFRFALAQDAFAHTGQYDIAIASTLYDYAVRAGNVVVEPRPRDPIPLGLGFSLSKLRDLRYGENPHQKAALFEGFFERFTPWEMLQGKELSYTNLLDLDAAARVALEFAEPAAVVVKHTNPCGVATGASAADAYVRAREADSVAAYGGIAAIDRPIDAACAEALVSTFIEAVIAPAVDAGARPILARKANMRVVVADFERLAADHPGHDGEELRSTLAGVLVQQRDRVIEAREPWRAAALPDGVRVVTKRQPTAEEWDALRFAWRVCAHVKSNAVVFTDAQRTLAIGAGQMSRVDAVRVAVMKAFSAARR